MREGKHTVLTRIRGGRLPRLQLAVEREQCPRGGRQRTGVHVAPPTGPGPTADDRLPPAPRPGPRSPPGSSAPRAGPAHARGAGPRPRARPRRFCANTSCPRPGSLQRAHTPPRRWFLPGPGIPPSRPPGGWFLPRPIISNPSPQSPPSPPRKYSAHKYGG